MDASCLAELSIMTHRPRLAMANIPGYPINNSRPSAACSSPCSCAISRASDERRIPDIKHSYKWQAAIWVSLGCVRRFALCPWESAGTPPALPHGMLAPSFLDQLSKRPRPLVAAALAEERRDGCGVELPGVQSLMQASLARVGCTHKIEVWRN